uniref:Ig-like domain-containing protein n=1 Tax=Pundamilia nyererei TaxID=303518 RepID=A0A3B4GIV2_9CICH
TSRYYCVLFFLLLTFCSLLNQTRPLTEGNNVTFHCSFASRAKYLSWYKQVIGESPRVISSFYKHLLDSNSFHPGFKNNQRISIDSGENFYRLNIFNVQDSDSAMYYCGQTSISVTKFDDGMFLVLRGNVEKPSHRTFLKQPESNSVQQGDSVTLNCTLLKGSSAEGDNVYWFKKDTVDSHLGIMYSHKNSSSHCAKKSESSCSAQRCVYSFTKKNVSRFDVGTYYCAVASCGEVLVGKGTRLDVFLSPSYFPLLLTLRCFLCLCSETGRSCPCLDCAVVQYATVNFKKKTSRRQRKDTVNDPIYSAIRTSHVE